jgi:hypothetical protein
LDFAPLIAKLFAPSSAKDLAMLGLPKLPALAILLLILANANNAIGEEGNESLNAPPATEQTPANPATSSPAATLPQSTPPPKEKLARIWSNEPPLVRLARDKFGSELTETDAKFFAAVAANEWADFRSSSEATFDPEEPTSWNDSPTLKADRLSWLCTDPAASKLVPSHGIWLRGVNIVGKVDLYRSNVPFSLTFYDCLFHDGINMSHAKLQELDIRNCCSAAVHARAVEVAENVYFLTTAVFGGLDFIDAHVGGDFDFSGGLAFHGTKSDDIKEPGIALNFHDAKVDGDIKLGDKFRSLGQVRLIGATIGRSLACGGATCKGGGLAAIDARRTTIGSNVVFTTGFVAEGGVELRRAKIGGDLDCNGGRFTALENDAFNADLVSVGGQALLGEGFHAEGETRLINATIGGDLDCDNGHFLHPSGDALSLDGTVIGRSLRIGADAAGSIDETKDLPPGFLTRGTLRLWGTQVNQDILADGATLESPTGAALLGSNLKVASRIVLTGVNAKGTVNLFAADIEHELDLRGSQFDGAESFGKIAVWANGIQVRGHVYCNQVDGSDPPYRFRARGLTSFQFATIGMHWDLYGAEFENPDGDALDASDCRVGGYVNLDTVKIDGRASFSRAKIDGMWILNRTVEPEKMRLDMRFGHIWVIKDERLADWPPAGQLQLEGLVYDHFDDDSPLDVHDRLAWLRRQYAPRRAVRRGSPDPAASADRRSPTPAETFGRSKVRGRETHAQQGTDDRYAVTPAQFQAAPPRMPSPMPSPMMVPPGPDKPEMPNPITPPPEITGGIESGAAPILPTVGPAPSATLPPNITSTPDAPPASVVVEPGEDTQVRRGSPDPAEDVHKSAPTADPAGRRYITQPYTQLASVYRAIGQDEQANTVLVARAERIGELAPPLSAQGLWYRYLGRLIGYGYEPFRAIKIGLVIILVGAFVFWIGARRNLMAETKLAEQILSSDGQTGKVSPTYPRFNAFVYSLDVFLPFVDLNQVCYWIPGEIRTQPRKSRNCLMHIGRYSLKWSTVLHSYLWFQTLAGWTLCTLMAAAVTGIVES